MMKKTAYLYIRVSTDEQADTGYSQRYQEETLKRYCDINNIMVKDAIFEDHSAKTFNRPAFTKLLVLLKKKHTSDLILFTKWDRFSRNAGDAYAMINTLNKLGVEPQAIEQPLDLSIPENKMMLAFYLAAPEVENDRRALNIIGGMRRARKEGRFMGKAPIGYKNKLVDGKKTIVIDPEQGAIMKWVFQELAKGQLTVRSVFLKAREKGLVTHSGRPVQKTPFWNAIRNPAYCGKIKVQAYKGEEELLVNGNHQALISEALWLQVQDVLDGKKKVMRTKIKVDHRFPLRGYLLCPQCGKLLTASSSKGRKERYHYYHCYSGCNVRFKAEEVNNDFKTELQRWKPHPAVGQLYKLVLQDMLSLGDQHRQSELKKIRVELHRLTEYKSRIRKLRIAGELDTEDYAEEKKETEQSQVKLEDRMAQLVQQDNIQPQIDRCYSLLSCMDENWEKKPMEWKRDFVGSMFPEKLQYSKNGFRTTRVNEVAEIMFNMGAAFSQIKMGQEIDFSNLSQYVAPLVHFSNHFLHDLKKLAALAA
ncbi:MAG: recombinase family protein [Flavipsychrobacter sp.]